MRRSSNACARRTRAARIFSAVSFVSFAQAHLAEAEEPAPPKAGTPTAPTAATGTPATPATPAAPATLANGGAAHDPTALAEHARLARDLETAPPPPSHVVYVQYGIAFTTEQVVSSGPICDNPSIPCIMGGGGGVAIRGGWRGSGPLYFGGAYEITKQDASNLYRIALLQQARAEGRYYLMTARVTEPYLGASLGVAGYGNEWAIDTWGPAGSVGGGIEYQVTRQTVVGLALAYRLVRFSRFTDTAGAARDAGIAQLVGLDLVLEQRGVVVRAGADDTAK